MRTPRWQSRRQLVGLHIPLYLRPWLFEEGSLTRRLVGHCADRFTLELLSSRWARPLPDEHRALGLGSGRTALVRQVYLRCGALPLVFARSVVPPRSLHGGNQRLARLGARPLAAVLFSPVRVGRGPIEVAPLSRADRLHGLATRDRVAEVPALWARRSLFFPAGRPVLVTEVFLPGLASLAGHAHGPG
jgi:chorismate--pyruvate lyase